jgi:hypothetical protein
MVHYRLRAVSVLVRSRVSGDGGTDERDGGCHEAAGLDRGGRCARPGGGVLWEWLMWLNQTLEALYGWYGINILGWQLYFIWLFYPLALVVDLLKVGRR